MTDTDKPDTRQGDGQGDDDLAVAPAKPKTKKPPLYKVIMHNDDFTPMEFVVECLMTYFTRDREQAVQIMLTVHTRGKAVAGTYTAQIAETKVTQVNDHARAHQHPLLCTMEQA
ncbi:ATP-dependent Clp protease adapter ClpS [Salinisphaera japonica]|uniref:ATP-dependent Clp protease adapter protein ClpS n=1 Tax=Salinisphaera japonica YTM-1 TaxID=1209778 RepID=A0A423PS18_9GAMM|nr:ATP-dependent Clp protease adapter ClpS [Salinisphaera japonica]ROO28387.1 ATP-dependent Clp protease ClpS [Salinisphaera japonica YTM-1]